MSSNDFEHWYAEGKKDGLAEGRKAREEMKGLIERLATLLNWAMKWPGDKVLGVEAPKALAEIAAWRKNCVNPGLRHRCESVSHCGKGEGASG